MIKKVTIIILILLISISSFNIKIVSGDNYPFLKHKKVEFGLKGSFFTVYQNSNENRKSNIELAVKSLDNKMVEVGEEFSFNKCVGERSEKRGYLPSKIILNKRFQDGIGGGVCQVSTTLYNALLLSNIKITEWHRHSLSVSYVSPSFDAMVNYHSADLKFINDTNLPVIIKAYADGQKINIKIYGEKSDIKIIRKSVITEEIISVGEENILDDGSVFPDLLEGESRIICFAKNGIKSEGYLYKYLGKTLIEIKKIRNDVYFPQKKIIVTRKTNIENEPPIEDKEIEGEEIFFDNNKIT